MGLKYFDTGLKDFNTGLKYFDTGLKDFYTGLKRFWYGAKRFWYGAQKIQFCQRLNRLLQAISCPAPMPNGNTKIECNFWILYWETFDIHSFFAPLFFARLFWSAAASVIEFQQGWNFGAGSGRWHPPRWRRNPRQNCNWLKRDDHNAGWSKVWWS